MTAAAVRPEPAIGVSLVRQQVSAILFSEEAKSQIIPLLPVGISIERILSTVIQVATENPEILQCTPASLIIAVGKGVKWDLEFGETVHLVPFNVNLAKKGETPRWEKRAKAIRDYKGDIELVVGSGAARYVEAQCFYESEHFEYEQGTNPWIKHIPIVDPGKRGKMIGAYAWAMISQRTPLKISVMAVAEIDKIRQEKSKSWKDGPLLDWYARKTLVHQVCKSIPKNKRLAEVLQEFDKEDLEIPDADFEVVGDPTRATAATVPETTAAPASEPVAVDPDYLTPPDDDVMTLEQASVVRLIGPPGSWGGKAGELLATFSTKHLESIRTWCAKKVEEAGEDPPKETMVNAITLLLKERAKDQTTLEFDSTKNADKLGKQHGTKPAEPKKAPAKLPF